MRVRLLDQQLLTAAKIQLFEIGDHAWQWGVKTLLSSGNDCLGNNGKVNLSKLSLCRVLTSNKVFYFKGIMYRNVCCETKGWIWKIDSTVFLMHPGMSTYNMNTIVSVNNVRKAKGGCMLGFNSCSPW